MRAKKQQKRPTPQVQPTTITRSRAIKSATPQQSKAIKSDQKNKQKVQAQSQKVQQQKKTKANQQKKQKVAIKQETVVKKESQRLSKKSKKIKKTVKKESKVVNQSRQKQSRQKGQQQESKQKGQYKQKMTNIDKIKKGVKQPIIVDILGPKKCKIDNINCTYKVVSKVGQKREKQVTIRNWKYNNGLLENKDYQVRLPKSAIKQIIEEWSQQEVVIEVEEEKDNLPSEFLKNQANQVPAFDRVWDDNLLFQFDREVYLKKSRETNKLVQFIQKYEAKEMEKTEIKELEKRIKERQQNWEKEQEQNMVGQIIKDQKVSLNDIIDKLNVRYGRQS